MHSETTAPGRLISALPENNPSRHQKLIYPVKSNFRRQCALQQQGRD